MVRMPACLFAAVMTASFLLAAAPYASAQNVSGHVVTRKVVSECKKQARQQKLSYLKRRKFVRECVKR
jgi:hypothetical protein